MINIVGLHHRPGKLLQNIIIFVGALCRGNGGKAVTLCYGKFVSNIIKRLIPANRNKPGITLDQRMTQPLRRIDILEAETPFYTEFSLTCLIPLLSFGSNDLVVSDT